MEETRKSRVIKRYTNRKLYDTQESRYVTLEEIAGMVKAGEDVQIVDNRTGKDLTEVTLAQILYEEQKRQTTRMPLSLLKEIIRTRGTSISDFIQRTVTRPVRSFREEADRKVDELVRKSEAAVEDGTRQVRDFFASAQRALDGLQTKIDSQIHTAVEAVGSPAKLLDQLKGLRKRIEAIEDKIRKDQQ